MTLGPALMAVGAALYAFLPASSSPWTIDPGRASSWIPSSGYLTHVLPGTLLFGLGMAVMVAPLTTALMASVPTRHAGIASAFNNAVSRLGPQLVGGIVFVAVSTGYYAGLAERVPGLDVSRAETRTLFSPLNPPADDVTEAAADASRAASADSFHLAMWVSAGILALGAAINGFGITSATPSEAKAVRLGGQICVPMSDEM